MEKELNKIFLSLFSIFVGFSLLLWSLYFFWEYLAHPGKLWFVMIPYSRLFIAGIFGIMLIAAGFSLLFKKNYYLKLYKLIAYSLVVYGLDILFLGDIFDGYGLDNINLSRLYFIIFWVVAYFILRWTGKGENIRTILTNKTSMTYWGIAALIVILPDFVYFVLIIDYY